MRKPIRKQPLFSLSLVFISSVSFAQIESKYSMGVNLGMLVYQGDLTPARMGSFKTPGFVLGVNGSRKLSPVLSARLDLNFGQLKGDDAAYKTPAYRQQRAFAFTSPVTEVTASVVYEPLGREKKFSPYLFAGAGLASLNIQRNDSRFNAAYFETEPAVIQGLREDSLHRLPRTIFVLPVGVGLRYRLSEKLSLHSEAAYRIMSTDYLDGYSQSVNPALKDHYFKYSVGGSFSLGGRSKYDCPSAN